MNSTYLSFIIVITLGVILILYVFSRKRKKVVLPDTLNLENIKEILASKIEFYQQLNAANQDVFANRVQYFLQTTKISPEKGASITIEDKVLVAASGTIPLFHYQNWSYENLDEVLVYPDYFNEKYNTLADDNRNVAGMVGSGAMRHKMILSLPALRSGFAKGAQSNTAIHEFVHLIDMADGAVDGVPEYLIPKNLIYPWLHEMSTTIREIHQGKSDIRAYAAKNEAEFFAVLSEYFFEKPKMLEHEHPELYAILNQVYSVKK